MRREIFRRFSCANAIPAILVESSLKKIEPLLSNARKKTRPRTLDLYEVFCGILYLLKSGCQWRMLPSDFPKWRSIHAYFQIWSAKTADESSLLEQALKKISWRGPYQQWSDYEDKLLHR
jgi:transposase